MTAVAHERDQQSHEAKDSKSNDSEKAQKRPPWWIFASAIIVGGLCALTYGTLGANGRLAIVELLLANASLSVGGLLGFLFGIPRMGQNQPASPVSSRSSGAPIRADLPDSETYQRREQSLAYQPSTNLEQIADWLTKILIGVGLVQFSKLGESLQATGQYVSAQLGDGAQGAALVTQVVLILFAVVGFLLSLLWTRIYYGEILARADRGIWQILDGVVRKLDEQEVKSEKTTKVALAALTSQQMAATGQDHADAKSPRRVAAKLLRGSWPERLQERVRKFQATPPDWDSNPNAELFADMEANPLGRVWEVPAPMSVQGSLIFTFRVHGSPEKPLTGPVTFLLHPTFSVTLRTVQANSQGIAELTIAAGGWFTAVAIADDGQTVLLKDLREVPNVPAWFKKD
jgi:hypothetical protein